MKAACRFLGHKWPQGVQVWSKTEQRDGDGVWLGLRTLCVRCGDTVNAGSLYLQTSELRAAIAKATA